MIAVLLAAALSAVPGDLPFSRWFTSHPDAVEVQIARVAAAEEKAWKEEPVDYFRALRRALGGGATR